LKPYEKTKTKQKFIVSLSLIFFTVFLSGCGCKPAVQQRYAIELEVWGLFDDSDVYNDIFNIYTTYVNNNVVRINYRKFTPDTYKKEIIGCFGNRSGTRYFLIHNTLVAYFGDKIVPAPMQILDEKGIEKISGCGCG